MRISLFEDVGRLSKVSHKLSGQILHIIIEIFASVIVGKLVRIHQEI